MKWPAFAGSMVGRCNRRALVGPPSLGPRACPKGTMANSPRFQPGETGPTPPMRVPKTMAILSPIIQRVRFQRHMLPPTHDRDRGIVRFDARLPGWAAERGGASLDVWRRNGLWQWLCFTIVMHDCPWSALAPPYITQVRPCAYSLAPKIIASKSKMTFWLVSVL